MSGSMRYYVSFALFITIGSQFGCRACLPNRTCSNLWTRTAEDRADWHLQQMGHCPNPTHRESCMTDWTKGYYRGYVDAALAINQLPCGNYPAVWKEGHCELLTNDIQVQQGYQAGYHQASYDGLINVATKK
jgi:hypothetical protein